MKKIFVAYLLMVSLLASSFAQNNLLAANIADGEYNFEDSKQSFKVVIKNDNLEKFELNGVLIPASDYTKYDDLINNAMDKLHKHQVAMDRNERDVQAHERMGKRIEEGVTKSVINYK